jgi:dienelactone hydrolase
MQEENFEISASADSIPASLWLPEGQRSRAVVLLGHGLGVDRHHEYNLRTATLLTAAGCSVLAPELPLHGERRTEEPADWNAVVSAWQAYWASGGIQALKEEWYSAQSYATDRFPGIPIGYFGLSLGTQYGVPFLADNDAIEAAVLGLFGSLPRPQTRVMNRYAPRVSCPVAFIKQVDDEIHPSETSDHLFSILGSTTKKMIAGSGRHAEVPLANMQLAAQFLMRNLGVR